jgi:2-haloalkanoic acid dehalogenase type II
MTIRLITFDLDDTLWDVAPVMHSAEATLRAWLGEHAKELGAVSVEHLWAIRERLLSAEPALKHRLSELRRRILRLALQEAGYIDKHAEELAEAGFEVFLAARHQVTLFPDVHATLEQLANHYQLAVITNGNADVRRLGLAEYFKFALCAEELGIGKPDPLPFQRALTQAGVNADQALHIGDHPVDDIAGAQAAGLRCIWFNPLAKDWSGGARANGEVRRLSELPALLASWH